MFDAAGRKRLAQLLAMGSSAHVGERANALGLADKLVRQHQLTWEEILHDGGLHSDLVQQLEYRLDIATDACKQLQIENERLRHDLARAAKAAANGAGPGAVLLRDHARQAQWIIELHEAGDIQLRRRDREFCATVSHWHGDLTDKQRPWFVSLLDRVCRTTGRMPP
jgi:hypothetical protein